MELAQEEYPMDKILIDLHPVEYKAMAFAWPSQQWEFKIRMDSLECRAFLLQ